MVINKMKMWFIVLAVTVSFRVITFMSMLSMKRIMIMRMMMESTERIFHNLETMIILKQIMLTTVSHMIMLMKSTYLIFHNLEAMIMLKLLMLTMVSHMRWMLSRFGLGGLAKHQLLMTELRREVRLRGVT